MATTKKIIFGNTNGVKLQMYSEVYNLGIESSAIYYQSAGNHNFYTGGSDVGSPQIQMGPTSTTFNTDLIMNPANALYCNQFRNNNNTGTDITLTPAIGGKVILEIETQAPTPTAGDNTTKIATTAFVATELSNTLSSYALLNSVVEFTTVKASSFTAGSDYRIKQNVRDISPETTVDQLNPVTYTNIINGTQDMGFIAHEVQEHFPFLVSGEKDGPTNQSINYNGFIALLTKEIQDLKQRMITLEERLKPDNTTTFDNSLKTTNS